MRLTPRLAFPAAMVLALALGLGTLRVSSFGDDLMHQVMLERLHPLSRGPWDLFVFATGDAAAMAPLIEQGPYPWWVDPEFKLRFFRPVSSLLLAAEYHLYGTTSPWAHLHSVGWYLLLVAGAALVFRRVLAPRAAALAMLLFAVDGTHWFAVAWIANRYALNAVAPAVLAVWAHLRWRQDGWRPGALLAPALLLVGLLGAETALACAGLVAAWELWGAPGPLRARLRALAPMAATVTAYLLAYKALGYGAAGSPVYVDPGANPALFLAQAPGRALAALAALTLAVPSDIHISSPTAAAVLAGVGILGTAVWALLFRALWAAVSADARTAARWLACGALLSLVPSLATFPADRLLLVPSVAAAGLLGVLLDEALARPSWGWKAVVGGAALLHVALPLAMWVALPAGLARADAMLTAAAVQSDVPGRALAGRVVCLTAPDLLSGLYTPLYRHAAGLGLPHSWNLLSTSPHDVRVSRPEPNTLEFEVLGGHLLDSTWERLFRDPDRRPLEPGAKVRLAAGTLEVLEAQNGRPRRFALRFDGPLEDYTLITWEFDGLRNFKAPAVGESVVLHPQRPVLQVALGRKPAVLEHRGGTD